MELNMNVIISFCEVLERILPIFLAAFLGYRTGIFIQQQEWKKERKEKECLELKQYKNCLFLIKREIESNNSLLRQVLAIEEERQFPTFKVRINDKEAVWNKVLTSNLTIEYLKTIQDIISLYERYDHINARHQFVQDALISSQLRIFRGKENPHEGYKELVKATIKSEQEQRCKEKIQKAIDEIDKRLKNYLLEYEIVERDKRE